MAIVYISRQGSADMQLPAEGYACMNSMLVCFNNCDFFAVLSHISSGQSGGRLSREPLSKKGPISWLDMPA